MIKSHLCKKLVPLFIVGIFTLSLYAEVSADFENLEHSNLESDAVIHSNNLRLMSLTSLTNNKSSSKERTEQVSSLSSFTNDLDGSEELPPQTYAAFPGSAPRLDVGGSSEGHVVIDKISPEAMEINATQMEFILNFTIINSPGNPSSAFDNLTISNSTDTFLITTWSDWYFSVSPLTDNYSLTFILNSTVLYNLTFGDYNLTIFTDVIGHISSDFIPLPMKDLRIQITSITAGSLPYSEFNNKFGEDQLFNITVQVTEFDGTSTNSIQVLPEVLDTNALNINPNVTLISEVGDQINLLYLSSNGFVDNSSSSAGIFKFEVNLTKTIATFEKYPDGNHTLSVTITSNEGITANATAYISSQGTVLLLRYKEITIGSNNPLDYNNLVDNAGLIDVRVNPDDWINITYEIIDNGTGAKADGQKVVGQLLTYQDPNQADDPFAIITVPITITSNGTINLTASVITPSSGYPLLLYVRGHRTSQEQTPSNITIYWDQLIYQYTYFDDLGETGSDSSYNQKALGIDTNSWWGLQLAVYYASDNSPALTSQISYRFSGQSWQNVTDGSNGDPLDGIFLINYTHSIPEGLLFECQIVNGSITDPLGTMFVNETLIASTFSLSVTWTYLVVDLSPLESDRRLGTSIQTGIDLIVTWAHDSSVYSGFIVGSDWLGIERDLTLVNGQGTWSGLIQIDIGSYRYRIVRVNDPLFGITRFTNTTGGVDVLVDLIWEEIYFSFSNVYNSSISPSTQNFQDAMSFFANFGNNATLYVYGNHTYDGAPFQGIALLYDFDHVGSYPLNFDSKGVAIWTGDLSVARLPVTFSVMEITSASVEDWGVTTVYTGGLTEVIIAWDKIVVTFETELIHPHGTWVDVNVSFSYLVYLEKSVNLSTVQYDLLLTNGTLRSDISWTSFRDYSIEPAIRWYNVTGLFDPSTGITGFITRYLWSDRGMVEPEDGNLAVAWIDDRDPRILEFYSLDLGNGTILIIVDVTDDGEDWIGSGIVNVTLYDTKVEIDVPQKSIFYREEVSQGVWRYGFKYSFNQTFPNFDPELFKFEYEDVLTFTITVRDNGSLTLPGVGTLSNFRTFQTLEFSIEMSLDEVSPYFSTQADLPIIVTYLTNDSSEDGQIFVSVIVQDDRWSGLSSTSVQLTITDYLGGSPTNYNMTLKAVDGFDVRSKLNYTWSGILTVLETYDLLVTITDIAGNSVSSVIPLEVEDHIAPRVETVTVKRTEDRKLDITVQINESGVGVDSVYVQIVGHEKWYELTYQGGIGGFASSVNKTWIYSAIIPLEFDFNNVILPKDYEVIIRTKDLAGNQREFKNDQFNNDQFKFSLEPVILEPVVLILGAILLIITIVVGIRITSKTEGYDMKRIISESEKVSRQAMLTLMDEYALGVTVNFFDQVQGPVPVIWEPPLLEDQQQVMLDLSDKSFSTLEFVGLDEVERSGTFDFSTGSYECTALGYSFAVDNPQARGGKENLTIVLLLRKEWGDNLLTFQDELVEKLREIGNMIINQEDHSKITAKARQLREFVSRIMIAFNKIYTGVDYEESYEVE